MLTPIETFNLVFFRTPLDAAAIVSAMAQRRDIQDLAFAKGPDRVVVKFAAPRFRMNSLLMSDGAVAAARAIGLVVPEPASRVSADEMKDAELVIGSDIDVIAEGET